MTIYEKTILTFFLTNRTVVYINLIIFYVPWGKQKKFRKRRTGRKYFKKESIRILLINKKSALPRRTGNALTLLLPHFHFHWYPHGIYPLQGKGIRTDIEITYELSTQVKKLTYVNNSPYVFVVNVKDISSNNSVRQRSLWADLGTLRRNIITSQHLYTVDQACLPRCPLDPHCYNIQILLIISPSVRPSRDLNSDPSVC